MSDLVIQPDMKMQQAKLLSSSDLVPDIYKGKPANIYLAILTGEALGIHPVTALSSIAIIKGKPTISSELMRALILKAGHRFKIEATATTASVNCSRKEYPEDLSEFIFTIEDAQRAGLASSDTWKKYPAAMLTARVTSMAARAMFADCLAGVSYTPEEIGGEEPQLYADEEVKELAPAPVWSEPGNPKIRKIHESEPANDKQLQYLGALVRKNGYTDTAEFLASGKCVEILGGQVSSPVLKQHASALIEALKVDSPND
jgi:hypothetical protein